MIKIETYWIDDLPTLEDINTAYDIIRSNNGNVMIELKWHFPYSGTHTVRISPKHVNTMSPTEFFNNEIPHTYAV